MPSEIQTEPLRVVTLIWSFPANRPKRQRSEPKLMIPLPGESEDRDNPVTKKAAPFLGPHFQEVKSW